MCFYHEADWIARVCEWSSAPAERPVTCDECRVTIQPGEMCHHLHQQEYEECHDCEQGWCHCTKDDDDICDGCQCEEPNLGESYEHDECDSCHRFLAAVAAVEKKAGCPPHASRPALGQMQEDICEGGIEEARKYWKKAIAMHPELKASGYLGRLWKAIFA